MGANFSNRGVKRNGQTFFFMVRRVVDLDHYLPIVVALLESGIDPSTIGLIVVARHHSLGSISIDVRLKLIRRFGVNIEVGPVGKSYCYAPLAIVCSYLLIRFLTLCAVPGCRWILGKTRRKIAHMIEKETTLISTDGLNDLERWAFRLCKRRGGMNLIIQHGVVVHSGFLDEKVQIRVFGAKETFNHSKREANDYEDVDEVSCIGALQAAGYSGISKKVKILGSPRLSQIWIKKYGNMVPAATSLCCSDKLNVLFFIEKRGFHSEDDWVSFVDTRERTRLLEHLSNHKSINLILKTHPGDTHPIDDGIKGRWVFSDSEWNSFQLTKAVDVVVGTTTTALADGRLMGKIVIIPTYISPFRLLYSDYNLENVVRNFEEFARLLQEIIQKKSAGTLKVNHSAESDRMLAELFGSIDDSYNAHAQWLIGDN